MSDGKTVYFTISKIRNVWARRLVIALSFPFFVVLNAVFAIIAAVIAWCEANTGLVSSARKQWRKS